MLLVCLCLVFLSSSSSSTPRVSGEGAESCQDRAVASARGRGCGKSCLLDQDCPTKRQCLCDGQCGWSCIMPTRSCPWPLSFPYSTSLLLSPSPSFSSLVQTRCDPGFKMADGTELVTRRCQGDRSWSGAEPVCMAKPTESPPLCPPLGQIENGITLQDRNSSEYTCHPGFRLIGSRENFCLENGSWQYPEPICEQVFCPPPADVAAGYLVAVQRSRYEVGEVIYYLCRKGFLLDGPNRVVCESDGSWGHTPFCRARCPIPAQRSRVLLGGSRLWGWEIPEGGVEHGTAVAFYCRRRQRPAPRQEGEGAKERERDCSYTSTQHCFDGTLELPQCYEEPTWLQYQLFPHRLVSEIDACDPDDLPLTPDP